MVLLGFFAGKSHTCQFGRRKGNCDGIWGGEDTFEESPSYDVGEGLFSRERGEMAGWGEMEKS